MSKFKQEAVHAMQYMSAFTAASTTIGAGAVNYWLENHSDTIFLHGQLRRVKFTMITPEAYKLTTEAI